MQTLTIELKVVIWQILMSLELTLISLESRICQQSFSEKFPLFGIIFDNIVNSQIEMFWEGYDYYLSNTYLLYSMWSFLLQGQQLSAIIINV